MQIEVSKEEGGTLIAALAAAILLNKSGVMTNRVPYASADAMMKLMQKVLSLELYPDDMAQAVQQAKALANQKTIVH